MTELMDELIERRRAMRHLIDPRDAADAQADYYAFHHPDFKTQIVTYRPDTARAVGYVCLSRTGIDLFRPFVTLRLPLGDHAACRALLQSALPPGLPVIMSAPAAYLPLVRALCDVTSEQEMALLVLDRGRMQTLINVLVVSETQNNKPVFKIQRQGDVAAAAGVNWETAYFADVHVRTHPLHRRQGWGQSVVSALAQHIVSQRKTPIYTVSVDNEASQQMAQQVGFVDTGRRTVILEAALRG
jgi:hypothetical protein